MMGWWYPSCILVDWISGHTTLVGDVVVEGEGNRKQALCAAILFLIAAGSTVVHRLVSTATISAAVGERESTGLILDACRNETVTLCWAVVWGYTPTIVLLLPYLEPRWPGNSVDTFPVLLPPCVPVCPRSDVPICGSLPWWKKLHWIIDVHPVVNLKGYAKVFSNSTITLMSFICTVS